MRLALFFNTFAVTAAVSLVALAVLPFSWELALRVGAACAGLALLAPILVPPLRGVRKGDRVMVVTSPNGGLMATLMARSAVALENAKKDARVRVRLDDGSEQFAVVDSYIGFFSPARVRITPPRETEIKII